MQRRQFLLGTSAVITGSAGCSILSSGSSMLDVLIFNQTDYPFTVELTLLRTDDTVSRSDARAYSTSIDIGPQKRTQREAVAEARPYVIQYRLYRDNSRLTDEDHVHFYPTDDGSDDSQTFDINPNGILSRR